MEKRRVCLSLKDVVSNVPRSILQWDVIMIFRLRAAGVKAKEQTKVVFSIHHVQ